jgi:hypothetical protein
MAQHRLKIILTAGGFIAALAVGVCGDAYAFTETTVPSAKPQASQPAPAPQLQTPGSDSGLQMADPGATKSGGTELKIPGIGSLGTVPKLDFGLDLLYGNGADPAQEPRALEGEKQEDVTIKGTIRHRF